MELRTLLNERRSNRAFNGKPVTSAQVQELLYAATKAPNACNLQSWHFYALDQQKIADMVPTVYKGEWIKTAGVAFVVCTEDGALTSRFGERGKLFAIQDTAAAMTMLLLRATDLGLTGCWIGAFDPDECRRFLSIPDTRTPVAIAMVGYADELPPLRERKPLEKVSTLCGEFPVTDGEELHMPYTLSAGSYSGARFEDLNLPGADFSTVVMQNAKFDNVAMQNAKFDNIDLANAVFTDINLSGSTYAGVYMAGVHFGAADAKDTCVEMDGAVLTEVSLTDALLRRCHLQNAKLEGCDLEGLTIDGMPAKEYFTK